MAKVTSMTRTLMLACLVSLVVPSLHAQSLADAAKKAEEKRGAAAKAKTGEPKVYTKKDVEALPPEVLTPQTTTPSTEKSATAPEVAESNESRPARDEAYWKARMAPLRIRHDEDLRAAARVKADLRNVESYMRPTQWNFTVYGPEWLRLTKELSSWEAILRTDEQAIAALEEEGRVAGALPGWLR